MPLTPGMRVSMRRMQPLWALQPCTEGGSVQCDDDDDDDDDGGGSGGDGGGDYDAQLFCRCMKIVAK